MPQQYPYSEDGGTLKLILSSLIKFVFIPFYIVVIAVCGFNLR